MPSEGLSLVGFLSNQDHALNFLRNSCVHTFRTDLELISLWKDAKAKTLESLPRAGMPEICETSSNQAEYIETIKALPQVSSWLQYNPGTTFKLIEIDQLLAYQISINVERSNHHCGSLSKPPTEDELYKLALPAAHDTNGVFLDQRPQSVVIKTRNLNLSVTQAGIWGNFAGLMFDFSLAMVHVVRFNNRCYLHNGFHRAYGARLAGATHIPCLFRDVSTPESVGIKADGTTLDLASLESDTPPTLAHYGLGLACRVHLRTMSRIMHVSWAEYVLPDE